MVSHLRKDRKGWRFGSHARGRGIRIFCILMLGFMGFALFGSGDVAAETSHGNDNGGVAAGSSACKRAMEGVDYVVIGWNDLGMHCINPSYKDLAILPPFNNLWVQVIKRGEPPQIVTSGVSVEYEIIHNTTVQGKTDFWTYIAALFGPKYNNWPLGVGLTGTQLSGKMEVSGDHFEAVGIPLLPRNDNMKWNPYQLASLTLRDANTGKVLKKTKISPVVLPISDELNCAQCHAQGGDGTMNINGGTASVDANILAVHDYYHSELDLSHKKPVMCANCHPDNAVKPLGVTGDSSVSQLSKAMHGWHAQFPDAGCYSCHPGAKTQCMRTAIGGMGYRNGTDPSCPSCHGQSPNAPSEYSTAQSCMLNLAESAASVQNPNGRQCWVQGPSCEQCHGVNYTTGQELFRNSKGHGGVYCAGCHNSPHSWWPSKRRLDNFQPTALQKNPMAIGECRVCHLTKTSLGNNPHVSYLFNKNNNPYAKWGKRSEAR